MPLNSIDKKLAAGSLHVTSNTTGYVAASNYRELVTSCVFSVRENKNLHDAPESPSPVHLVPVLHL